MKQTTYQKNYTDFYRRTLDFKRTSEGEIYLKQRTSHIPYPPNPNVLDVACGINAVGRAFGNNVWGFDLNPEAVRQAKKMGIRATYGDAEKKWHYKNNFFDIVIASHIIEHVVNPDAFVLEAKRVLKKGGFFVIATPNLAAWFNRILLIFGIQPFYTEVSTIDRTLGYSFIKKLSPAKQTIGHVRVFTPSALTELLLLHGFAIECITGVEFSAFPPVLLHIDRLFAHSKTFASNIIVVAKKTTYP